MAHHHRLFGSVTLSLYLSQLLGARRSSESLGCIGSGRLRTSAIVTSIGSRLHYLVIPSCTRGMGYLLWQHYVSPLRARRCALDGCGMRTLLHSCVYYLTRLTD